MFPASLAFSFCCRGDREQRRLAKQFQTACEHARYEVEALDGPARLTIDLAVRRENCTGPKLGRRGRHFVDSFFDLPELLSKHDPTLERRS